jgi:lysyl-tRNA synthetase class 2
MADAGWRPTATTTALHQRARLLAFIRDFMAQRDILEVETPVLSQAGNSDPAIELVATAETPARWLRSSPEYPMKRLLAAGIGDVYELGRVFRAGERGRHHNPEFTLLEWYRLGWTHRDLAGETADLVVSCGTLFDRQWARETLSYGELFERQLGLDPHRADSKDLAHAAREHGIELAAVPELSHDAWLDLLVSHVIQPAMAADTVTVVVDYPASQAALARIRPGDPPVAERFEVFIGSVELANGYFELANADEQRRRFEHENDHRARTGGTPVPVDEYLLDALAAGFPDCAGVALGVDRLLMACLGVDSIDTVLAFPGENA